METLQITALLYAALGTVVGMVVVDGARTLRRRPGSVFRRLLADRHAMLNNCTHALREELPSTSIRKFRDADTSSSDVAGDERLGPGVQCRDKATHQAINKSPECLIAGLAGDNGEACLELSRYFDVRGASRRWSGRRCIEQVLQGHGRGFGTGVFM